MENLKTILITAYAVNPYKGSEDGTGWNISFELAKKHKILVITRKNNRPEIERYMAEFPDRTFDNMDFYYYDLPRWIMHFKHKIGERGYVLYYYFWQLFLPLFIRRKKLTFDIAHAVNFHSDSHPQFLWMTGKPVFWGPIGHHPLVPKAFLNPIYGRKNWLKDRVYNSVKFVMRNFDPFYYISKWSARRIFVINSGVNKAIRANPDKIIQLPAVANNTVNREFKKTDQKIFTVLSVGRFVYMKGFDVTIKAFARFYHELAVAEREQVKLVLVGKGEELPRMTALIEIEKLGGIAEVIHWVPKEEMTAVYDRSSVFCFGSHEGAGMVVPEALSFGLPIVCFDNYGPGELCDLSCAIKIKYGSYERAVHDFAAALHTLHQNKALYKNYSDAAQTYAIHNFQWHQKAEIISEAYAHLG